MAGPLSRALAALAALALLGYGGCALRRALASDATRLRWQLEAMVEAFAAGEVLPIVERLAPEFRETASGTTREELRGGLAWWFRSQPRNAAGALEYEVELDWSDFRCLPAGGEAADLDLTVPARFRRRPAAEPVWTVRIESLWSRQDGAWRCRRATLTTLAGRPIYR